MNRMIQIELVRKSLESYMDMKNTNVLENSLPCIVGIIMNWCINPYGLTLESRHV